jgi:hypothetical protein
VNCFPRWRAKIVDAVPTKRSDNPHLRGCTFALVGSASDGDRCGHVVLATPISGYAPELSDDEAEALIQELSGTINYARYPLSPRIQTLRAIISKLDPQPALPAAPPEPRIYAPSKGRYRRRG